MVKSQNIYEYKKVKTIEVNEFYGLGCVESEQIRLLKNKINELIIEQNHLMKDFELYKKAFKRHCLPIPVERQIGPDYKGISWSS